MEPLSEKRYLELHAPAGGDFLAARERLLAALPDGCRPVSYTHLTLPTT